ncbi:MAG: hypothetical protein U0441_18375 [Polyangiaceae bacterium]
MPRPIEQLRRALSTLRRGTPGLFLGAALLAPVGLVAASCTAALDLGGYEDAYASACALADRCYGPQYSACAARFKELGESTDWLSLAGKTGCLDSCSALYQCLDYQPICSVRPSPPVTTPEGATDSDPPRTSCNISEECCGYSVGEAVCEGGTCCAPTGTPCTNDYQCCSKAGKCDTEKNHTCGGVVCAAEDAPCLNSFQCCSGRCNESGRCESVPCPSEGFECDASTDCCDLQCIPDVHGTPRCTHPTCAQLGEPCTTIDDCCDKGGVCYKGDHPETTPSGVCSPSECLPNEADCSGKMDGSGSQCCSNYCDSHHHLCGQCVNLGEACSDAVPCCTGGACIGNSCQTCVLSGSPCAMGDTCCGGGQCDKATHLCP